MEKLMELLIQDHLAFRDDHREFRDEHKQLLIAQVVLFVWLKGEKKTGA